MASTPLTLASVPPSGTTTVAIDLGDRSYDILIGEGLLQDPATFAGLPKSSKALIVTIEYFLAFSIGVTLALLVAAPPARAGTGP